MSRVVGALLSVTLLSTSVWGDVIPSRRADEGSQKARLLLARKKPAAAEASARAALAKLSDDAEREEVLAMLGASLVDQHRYAQGEVGSADWCQSPVRRDEAEGFADQTGREYADEREQRNQIRPRLEVNQTECQRDERWHQQRILI